MLIFATGPFPVYVCSVIGYGAGYVVNGVVSSLASVVFHKPEFASVALIVYLPSLYVTA